MPPKSSASSATRKKHARKAAAAAGVVDQPPVLREKKGKKHRSDPPRVKQYIAPVKPMAAVRDPLDANGLAHRLAPELLVVLRSMGKKAAVTKLRALEELQSGWIDRCSQDENMLYAVLDMLPVWTHHLPANLVHPQRRVRQITATIHATLLRFEILRSALADDPSELVAGTWALAAHDQDRMVASVASAARVDSDSLYSFAERTLLDPDALYAELNPPPPAAPPPPATKRPTGVAPQTPQPARVKADELEENEQDRRARLRISAFGLLKHLIETTQVALPAFLASPSLWTSLHHAQTPPPTQEHDDEEDDEDDEYADYRDAHELQECFGVGQPVLRRAAWNTLASLVARRPLPSAVVTALSHAVLRSAWVEPDGGVQGAMWGGLLGFLRDHPAAWNLARSGYDEFLTTFLANACGGAPVSAYPSVVVVLSTLPAEILFPSDRLFLGFWAALGGSPDAERTAAAPALTTSLPAARSRASAAFVSALLECTIFVVRRNRTRESEDDGVSVFRRELGRVWMALDRRKTEDGKEQERLLHVSARDAATLLRGALESAAGVGEDLLLGGLAELGDRLRGGSSPELVCGVLEALIGDGRALPTIDSTLDANSPARRKLAAEICIREAGHVLMSDILRSAVSKEDGMLLVQALNTFGPRFFIDPEFAQSVYNLVSQRAYALLLTFPALLFGYFAHAGSQRQTVFRRLLTSVADHPEAAEDALRVLVGSEARKALHGLTAADSDASGPLDAFFIAHDNLAAPLLSQVLQRDLLLLSSSAYTAVLTRVIHAFAARVEIAVRTDHVPLMAFSMDLEVLVGVLAGRPELLDATQRHHFLSSLYLVAYVLPLSHASNAEAAAEEVVSSAANLWLQWRDEECIMAEDIAKVKRRLGLILCSTDASVSPEDILAALKEDILGQPIDLLDDIFPSKADLEAMLETLPPDASSPSLAVLHPDLPPLPSTKTRIEPMAYDQRGYSSYARIVAALLQAMLDDRRVAKEHVWMLQHVLSLALYAEDIIAVPTASSAVFKTPSSETLPTLSLLVAKARQLATYILTSEPDDAWRTRVLDAVTTEKPVVNGNPLAAFVVDVVGRARRTNASRDCRVLGTVLRHLLQDADKAEADSWLNFARQVDKTAPELCITIVSAISSSTLEPPRLERYRNELAADLYGIPASKAATQGLTTLRKLAASAPDADSDVAFLPQQRAVNVFKACQQWITSDDDEVESELQSAMTRVFFYLAPLLQNIPGTHWDLLFDIVEDNLESASLSDDQGLVVLARTLQLILLIQDLARTNKSLRATWEERYLPMLTLVRDLAAEKLDVAKTLPRSTCRELVLSIVQDIPASLITEETLPKMAHLLADPSADVQKMTYQLLTVATKKRTEHLVIEAAVDVEGTTKAELPVELLNILQTSLNFDQEDLLDVEETTVFGYLLGWMVVLDLFVDASLKVRSNYIDQLRSLDIIGTSFIPNLFSLLGVDQGISKAFKLDAWAIDEFYVHVYELGSTWSLQILAAHLYYRALLVIPSLIYSWVLDCKDKTLSTNIGTYTAQHFSSVLIHAELETVREAQLSDEQLTVKVAGAVNEVSASYLVDEHRLEIRLKIPSEWPLRKIEVKDVQRIGVDEGRWRAWILAVQQILWAQNGRIVDGIGLFKKNVQLHFEGQVECAICYSIISVMDGTLPKRPCKTCKNRFHSGCLYKWFSTSHSSSCPLCRSDII
ncbi:Delta-9 fatty acid desaturase protein [Mycena chlorophos]|uniref:E3 ubiquitin-protein ligase listerin n=1 Tax=Mycena chlorophos TaxID=658473 RepID=A0A8H6T297_MYCCL|nr:Delta-9 fatty acid desaturase protein [Mycena chlorophos]